MNIFKCIGNYTSSILLHLLLLCCFFDHPLLAQKVGFENDNQQWVQYINVMNFSPKWSLRADASYRWRQSFTESFVYNVRGALGYQMNDQLRFRSGLGYFKRINTPPATSQNSPLDHEIRPYQEIAFRQNFRKADLLNRLQMEERFLRRTESIDNESMYVRFRYALFFTFPLLEFNENENRWALTVRNELFVNGADNPKNRFFDLERISLGSLIFLQNWRLALMWHNQVSSPLTEDSKYRYTSIVAFQVLQTLNLFQSKE